MLEGALEELGLAEAVRALREELADAVAVGEGQGIQFTVGTVQMEFHAAIRREGGGGGKVRFYVLEASAEGRYRRETVQKVSLTLEPATADGQPVRVTRGSSERP